MEKKHGIWTKDGLFCNANREGAKWSIILCLLGGRYIIALIHCNIQTPNDRVDIWKMQRWHSFSDSNAISLTEMVEFPVEVGGLQIYMSRKKYLVHDHDEIDKVFLPRSPFPQRFWGAWPRSPTQHLFLIAKCFTCEAYLVLGMSYFVLQPKYCFFNKPRYAPRLLFTSPSKSHHSNWPYDPHLILIWRVYIYIHMEVS